MKIFAAFFLLVLIMFGTIQSHAMRDEGSVTFLALDKSTARTQKLTAKIGETVQYGSVYIKPRACRTSGAFETPENAAFLQIWEIPIGGIKSEWVFSGWMFSSSPALSAMDHPVYDIWVDYCGDKKVAGNSETKTTVSVNGETIENTPPEEETDSEPEDAPRSENGARDTNQSLDDVLNNLSVQE